MLDVRKGGLREDGRHFAVRATRVWLYPTAEHQRAELLKPAYRHWVDLAANAESRNIITIEGLSHDGDLDPVQQAFLKHQAFQCGYCTPGMIMAVKGLLASHPHPTEEQARDYLSGNLCRCGTYVEVLAAVRQLAQT